MNGSSPIARYCLLHALSLWAIGSTIGKMPDEPASLQDLVQILHKTTQSALSQPPPSAEESQDFHNAFLSDPYLRHFPRPHGEILSIVSELRYLWTYQRELILKIDGTLGTKKSRAKKTLFSDPHGLAVSETPPPQELTKEQEKLLILFRERVENIKKGIACSLAELEDLAQNRENQKFALQRTNRVRKALAKLEKSYEIAY